MANNRMYLAHVPSGKAVYLGKRMGDGYYDVPDDLADRVRKLFSETEWAGSTNDNFAVVLEDNTEVPTVLSENTLPIILIP